MSQAEWDRDNVAALEALIQATVEGRLQWERRPYIGRMYETRVGWAVVELKLDDGYPPFVNMGQHESGVATIHCRRDDAPPRLGTLLWRLSEVVQTAPGRELIINAAAYVTAELKRGEPQ